MHGVVELVGPLRVVAPFARRPLVAGLHLRDHQRRGRTARDALGELGEHVRVAVSNDRVRRVETQTVDVVVAHPVLGVLDRPLAHAALRVVDRPPQKVS